MSNKKLLRTLGANLIIFGILAIVASVFGIIRFNDIIDGTAWVDYLEQQSYYTGTVDEQYTKVIISVVLMGIAFVIGIVCCTYNSTITKASEKFGNDLRSQIKLIIWITWGTLAIMMSLALAYIVKITTNSTELESMLYYNDQLDIAKAIKPIAISAIVFSIVLLAIGGYSLFLSTKVKIDDSPKASTNFTGSSNTSTKSSDFSTGVNSPNASPLKDADEW